MRRSIGTGTPGAPAALIHRPLWLGVGWALVLAVVFLSLVPQQDLPPLGYDDKLGHLIAYAVLMAWFAQLHRHRGRLALSLLAMGAGLEGLQGLTGYRDMTAADVLANGAGVAFGWASALPLPNLLERLERFGR